MGIDPSVWGNHYWNVLLYSAANATDVRKRHGFKALVMTLAQQLPCEECQRHFNAMINTRGYMVDEFMINNEQLLFLVWKWKSAVNKRLNKPNLPWQTVRDTYLSVVEDANADGSCSACGGGKQSYQY